jgi:polysaccharide biosynthesis/export protein
MQTVIDRFARRATALLFVLMAAGMLILSAMPAHAAEATPGRGYVLGVDDVVDIAVYGAPEASVKTRIKHDGTIVLPMIGAIQAVGQTNVSLAAVIVKKLEAGNFYKNPIVNIEILTYSSQTVNIAGKVAQPGIYPLDKPYRVLELLLKAGWVGGQGAQYVYLRNASDGKEVRLATDALVHGTPDKDPLVAAGDTIFVPDADIFYIYGQIARPGAFPIYPGMTLREAVALSGGTTAAGSDRKITMFRVGGKETDADLDQLIQKNDVYVVKERLF